MRYRVDIPWTITQGNPAKGQQNPPGIKGQPMNTSLNLRPGTKVRVNCGTFYGLSGIVVALDGITMPPGHIAVMLLISTRPAVLLVEPHALDWES